MTWVPSLTIFLCKKMGVAGWIAPPSSSGCADLLVDRRELGLSDLLEFF